MLRYFFLRATIFLQQRRVEYVRSRHIREVDDCLKCRDESRPLELNLSSILNNSLKGGIGASFRTLCCSVRITLDHEDESFQVVFNYYSKIILGPVRTVFVLRTLRC